MRSFIGLREVVMLPLDLKAISKSNEYLLAIKAEKNEGRREKFFGSTAMIEADAFTSARFVFPAEITVRYDRPLVIRVG